MTGYGTVAEITVDFRYLSDVLLADGQMVISDRHRVIVAHSTMTVIHVWGSLTAGQGLGQFSNPNTIDRNLIYGADTNNCCIQVLNVTSTGDIEHRRSYHQHSDTPPPPPGIHGGPLYIYMFY